MKKELRDDQTDFINRMRVAMRTYKRIVAKAPTGYGKTIVAAWITDSALSKGKRVLFTVPLLSLIDQTVEAFYKQGIHEVGVIQADHAKTDWSKPVQVASVDTLVSRCTERYEDDTDRKLKRRLDFARFPQSDIVLIDEVHRWAKLYEMMVTAPELQKTPIIGLSATPWTKGLGGYFGDQVVGSTTRELIDQGMLSPFRVFAPTVHPDMEGVRSTGTINGRDYIEAESAERMSRNAIVADIIDTWIKRAEGRPTLLFAVNCAHAKLLQERFLAAAIPADYQDASTSMIERAAIKRRFHSGETKVVCNVGTLTMGTDWDVRCISLCRPTRSEILYVQIVGRGLRTAPGKDHLLLLDHSDSTLRLGFVDEIDAAHSEGLHNGKADAKDEGEVRVALPKECPNCGFIKPPRTPKCPNCGTVTSSHAPPINEGDGELAEITATRRRRKVTNVEKQEVYAGLLWIQRARGYKRGWVFYKYQAIFGVEPRGMSMVQPKEPDGFNLEGWIRRHNAAERLNGWRAAHPNGNGNGHAAPPREPPERGQFVPGTLMTQDDLEVDL